MKKKEEKNEISKKKHVRKRKKKGEKVVKAETEHKIVTKEVCTFKINKSVLRLFLESIGVILPDDISIVYTYKKRKED